MKKILVSILIFTASFTGFSQTNRTAYVDVYHILKKSPEYTEATLELEKRVRDWQTEIDKKKAEIQKLKDALSTERALLTQQLIEEKEDEIQLIQTELTTFQHDKFGTEGDYLKQKTNIYKPILDQIHTISNDIAVKKRLDIVLIKTEDNTMVYANKRNDITDLVLREMDRSRSRGKLSKKEIAQLEAQDKIQDAKERQLSKRDLLKERQKDLEDPTSNSSIQEETNSNENKISNQESDIDRKIRENQEKKDALKKKQDEIKQKQKQKIEDQTEALKKKQDEIKQKQKQKIEDQKEALKKKQDDKKALGEKHNTSNKSSGNSSNNSNTKQLSESQLQSIKQREQRVNDAKAKKEKLAEERKIKSEEIKAKRLKDIEDRKKNK